MMPIKEFYEKNREQELEKQRRNEEIAKSSPLAKKMRQQLWSKAQKL